VQRGTTSRGGHSAYARYPHQQFAPDRSAEAAKTHTAPRIPKWLFEALAAGEPPLPFARQSWPITERCASNVAEPARVHNDTDERRLYRRRSFSRQLAQGISLSS